MDSLGFNNVNDVNQIYILYIKNRPNPIANKKIERMFW